MIRTVRLGLGDGVADILDTRQNRREGQKFGPATACHDARQGGFASTAYAGKKKCVGDPTTGQGVAQRLKFCWLPRRYAIWYEKARPIKLIQ